MNSNLLTLPLSDILAARITIGYLGEIAQFNWWPTSFFAPTAKTFLDPIFSKTIKLAQYHGAVEAACQQHDEHLSTSSYHLFRLPEEVEADLDEGVRVMAPEQFYPQDRIVSMDSLKVLAGKAAIVPVGPVAIGSVTDIFEPDTIKAIASIYFAAFSSGTRAYPYFVRQ